MDDAQIEQYTLERLTDGDMLAEIAESLGMKRTTLYMRMTATPAKLDVYLRARDEGLMARGENLRRMAREPMPTLQSGGVDSAAVSQLKLVIETEKWTLAKLLSRVFGDKVQTELTGPNGGPIQTQALSPSTAALAQALRDLPQIDKAE